MNFGGCGLYGRFGCNGEHGGLVSRCHGICNAQIFGANFIAKEKYRIVCYSFFLYTALVDHTGTDIFPLVGGFCHDIVAICLVYFFSIWVLMAAAHVENY